ncbi:hypothetical protein BGT96224_3488 [Blumeria graminis f. sp. tritici 96224]|uniref:Bgt-3488 n=1 Tax=Blumeria graminis f. sp. tritici 96224 TaxID=1268274 RepID=A0A061HCX8_BLUGR|nr:hypothetical protein BGT96224_3488 [Blumeria graminis f. sp. tritici 96224]
MAGFVNRENRVPHYQRLFFDANKKHIRLWETSHRSKFMLYPYYTIMWGTLAASMYCMCRLVLGHKTWFGTK